MSRKPIDLGQINGKAGRPKYLQIADRIQELIAAGTLGLGDRLPSVNQVIAHFSVSRDTVVKAYQHLKERGTIESSPNLACFVSNLFVREGLQRVMLLMDAVTPYKERLYHGLLDALPRDYYVDLFTHNDDFELLRLVFERFRRAHESAACLIIPTAGQGYESEYFRFINPGRILFLDRPVADSGHPAVWQDFRNGFRTALEAESGRLAKYRRLVFLTKAFTNTIIEEMKLGLSDFAAGAGMEFRHDHTLFTDREITGRVNPEKGDLLVILDDRILIGAMEECARRSLVPGTDTGIIIINEGPFYSRLPVPVSVLSADFYAMGEAAARFVTEGRVGEFPVRTTLTVTGSL